MAGKIGGSSGGGAGKPAAGGKAGGQSKPAAGAQPTGGGKVPGVAGKKPKKPGLA